MSGVVEVREIGDVKLCGWADRISEEFGAFATRTVVGIISVGLMLEKAKDEVGHGQWGRMFHDHDDPIDNALPMSKRAADMFVVIAAHGLLSNGKHASHLPPSWYTLYELTKVPPANLALALTEGTINPQMERKDAVALRGSNQSKSVEPLPDRVCSYLGRQWDKCESPEERTLFIHLVQNFLEHVA